MLIAENNLFTGERITGVMIFRYIVITALSFIVISSTMLYRNRTAYRVTSLREVGEVKRFSYSHLLNVAVLCFVIGAFSRIYMLARAGGISYIWNNIIHRASMTAGMGYLDNLTAFMTYGVIFLETYYMIKKSRGIKILCYLSIAFASILLLAFGARSPLLKLAFAIFFVWYYRSKDRSLLKRIFKPKIVALVFLLIVIVITLPTFRNVDFEFNAQNIMAGVQDSSKNLLSIFDSISIYDEDIFTFDYFSSHGKWLGRSYIDLFYAWIPRSMLQNKPPVDDGVYLRSLMLGTTVVPSVPFSELPTNSSVPFSLNGIAYANFGILGCVFYGLLFAMVINKQYIKMVKSQYAPEEIFLYEILCTRLNFSVKGIVELLMTIIIYLVVKMFLKTRLVTQR